MQEYAELLPTSYLDEDRETLNKNFATIISDFSGTIFPTNGIAGMWCDRTDQQKIYRLQPNGVTWKLVFDYSSGTFIVPSAVYADSANAAVTDSAGQQIDTTYIKSITAEGSRITVKWGDDKTEQFDLPNTTYQPVVGATESKAGATGLVPAPAAGAANRYLRSDGTWAVPPNDNTTYAAFMGATAGAAGRAGLVPAPAAGQQSFYLRGDGTFGQINIPAAAIGTGVNQQMGRTAVGDANGGIDFTSSSGDYTGYRMHTVQGVGVGTYTIQDLLWTLAAKSHTHAVERYGYNCDCNCNCDCGDDCAP